MKEILEKLKNMDQGQLAAAVKQAKEFSKTPRGKQMIEKIQKGESGIDEDSVKKLLGKNPDIANIISDILKG